MDISRPSQAKAKRRKRILIGTAIVLALGGATAFLSRLQPAAPVVDRSLVWVDTVKRGPMIREVRGLGTLVPEDIRWIAARTDARVDHIVLRPGAAVTPNSIIVELSNPDVEQAAADAKSKLASAQAELKRLRIDLKSDLLSMESTVAQAKSTYETSRLKAAVNTKLYKDGLVSELELNSAKVAAQEASTVYGIEKKRYAFTKDSMEPRLSVKRAEIARLEDTAKLRQAELAALHVRAGIKGVLQQLPIEVGQQVKAGTNIARVADPTKLKAQVRIPETQAKDVQIGQKASIDTRNGIVPGRVSRIDPAVENGTVTVDVTITGKLPKGSRPDMSIDGTIELERLKNVVYVGRPAFGQENSTVGMFKLTSDGKSARRVQVKLGLASVNKIEILKGLVPGDQVILSDMSQWDSNDRIRLH